MDISDVGCCDCGGRVELYIMPDPVWCGLGFALADDACLACVAWRLNPAVTVEFIDVEIYRQRNRFRLDNVNKYSGLELHSDWGRRGPCG